MKITAELSAALAGRYVVEREIGRGGMAVVYLARDTKHDRLVAVKVLNPELGAMLGAERFLAEIRTTATLQHPNLLPLFDSGEAGGLLYYVMPFLEGESLRARLEREGQLPLEDAVRIAVGIANALSYAHAHGVIHRDLKPENVLLQHGQPVVLDFGVALALRNAAEGRRTQTGISVGTPQYMSPEQAAGEKIIDARADIYALGALTYEMLAGEAPHTGPSAQAIITKVMAGEVRPVTSSRPSVPAYVASAVQRALARVPADRFSTAAEFARAIENPTSSAELATPLPLAVSRRRPILPWAVAAVAAAAAFTIALRPGDSSTALRLPIFASLDVERLGVRSSGSVSFSVSPDGRHVALAVEREDDIGLAVRSLDSIDVRNLRRTRDAYHPFWSPDSKSIAFFTDDSLKIVDLASGTVRSLCRTGESHGGTWSPEGIILFSTSEGLARTSAAGGSCDVWLRDVRDGRRLVRPYFFPDGRHFIATGDQQVWLGDLRSDSLVRLRDLVRAEAVLAAPDYLLWRGSDGVLAQRIDVSAKRFIGEPVRVLPSAANPGGHIAVSASATGVIVRSAFSRQATDPAADATDGRSIGIIHRGSTLLEHRPYPAGAWSDLRISRDGRRISLGGWHIQAMDLASGRWQRIAGSVEAGRETSTHALWAPRDSAVVFVQALSPAVLRMVSMGNGSVRTLASVPLRQLPSGGAGGLSDLSPDGRRIAFALRTPEGGAREAWEYDFIADTVRRLFDAPGRIAELRYYPRDVWMAYQVGIEGETNVFVRSYRASSEPVRVSSSGGRWPRWSASGSELFYMDGEDNVVAVPVRLAGSVTLGTPSIVVPAAAFGGRRVSEFDVSPDGTRFVFLLRTGVRSLGLVLGWQALLR